MKIFKFFQAVVVALLLCFTASAQMAVVEYMKVHNESDYLEIEQAWKKFHELRVQKGHLVSWGLYRVMFTGADAPYHYVTVNTYADMKSYVNQEWSLEMMKEAHPEKSEADLTALMDKTGTSRTLSVIQPFWRLGGTETTPEKPANTLE